jgi:RHS repeat-associated protein
LNPFGMGCWGRKANRSSLVQGKMRRDTANGDFQMKFSYRDTSSIPGPEMQLRFRQPDGSNFGVVRLWPTSFNVSEVRAGATVLLGSGAWTTSTNTWYDVTLIADGNHIEVWRGPKGGAQTRVCSLDSATILSGAKSTIVVATNGTYSVDDFQMTAEDLSNTTYTYDAANQLTAMNANGVATNFTYDDWGRMAGKTQGSYAATYGYRFGDKLKSATSNFPGETASVAYNYDGLGKRRLEQLDNTTATWFRWSGWEESGEYAGVPNGWTVGAKQTGYVPGMAAYAGADPATADWRFNLNDHLGSPRQMLGQNKAAKARQDFSPYGELMRSAGMPLTVGYTGHRWDPAIGQYFAPFRYYNPQTARWNMRDPLGFSAGPNMYGYVSGNPVCQSDPLGLIPIDEIWDAANLCYDAVFGTWEDVGFDLAALAIPYVPAGLNKVAKVGDLVKDAAKFTPPPWMTKNEDRVFDNLEKNHGIKRKDASALLHKLKEGIEGNPDVYFDITGGVYSPSGDLLGHLTEGGKKACKKK